MQRNIPSEGHNLFSDTNNTSLSEFLKRFPLLRSKLEEIRSDLRELRYSLIARELRNPGAESPPDLRQIVAQSRNDIRIRVRIALIDFLGSMRGSGIGIRDLRRSRRSEKGSHAATADHERQSSSDDPGRDLSPSDEEAQPRGVKEDLSEISKTLTRQFWGVASFLAPPAAPQISDPDSRAEHRSEEVDQDDSDSDVVSGLRNDLSEIGGRFRSGISKLSSNKAVTEFTKIASNFLQFGSEERESLEEFAQRGVVGVTEEVVSFARDIALHPETWLDFPWPDGEEEEDLDMSDAQQEHALAVERLAPTLAALRIELCPGYMSEGCFWKIYFVLVHPRLTKEDAELLTSPQIAKTRAMLMHDIKTRVQSKQDGSGRGPAASETASSANETDLAAPSINNPESEPINISVVEPETSKDVADIEMDKHPLASTEVPMVDKQVIEEVSAPQKNKAKSLYYDEEDGDDWLKDDPTDIGGSSGTAVPLEDPEDVSFSDLEEDDEDEVPIKSKKVVHPSNASKGSNDWLDIEDIDVA